MIFLKLPAKSRIVSAEVYYLVEIKRHPSGFSEAVKMEPPNPAASGWFLVYVLTMTNRDVRTSKDRIDGKMMSAFDIVTDGRTWHLVDLVNHKYVVIDDDVAPGHFNKYGYNLDTVFTHHDQDIIDEAIGVWIKNPI